MTETPNCEMLTGFLVAPDGDPGDEVWCTREAEAVVDGTKICGSCFLSMYLEDPDLVKSAERMKK